MKTTQPPHILTPANLVELASFKGPLLEGDSNARVVQVR
jgi:hypothetical protein